MQTATCPQTAKVDAYVNEPTQTASDENALQIAVRSTVARIMRLQNDTGLSSAVRLDIEFQMACIASTATNGRVDAEDIIAAARYYNAH